MFDMEKIMKMTPDDIIIINGLCNIAKEAKADAKKIADAYHCFGIGETIVEVWHDSDRYNHEYLTHDGTWQARYLHQSYDVQVDAESIFDLYRAEWLIDNGYIDEHDKDGYITTYGRKKEVCRYFRSFVKHIK